MKTRTVREMMALKIGQVITMYGLTYQVWGVSPHNPEQEGPHFWLCGTVFSTPVHASEGHIRRWIRAVH